MSFNATRGVTRGLHAEPWDKYISVGTGAVFGAWCDLREGSATYGVVVTATLTPDSAVFVPRGVANGFQALVDNTLYSYLVTDHWHPAAAYSFVNLADPALGINWPIPLAQAELSGKDLHHPPLAQARPVPPRKTIIFGASGQLGQALAQIFPTAELISRAECDLTTDDVARLRHWPDYDTIINAAAYTAVDAAEESGRVTAWQVNATAVAALARIATTYHLTLVHISTDYVFDGAVRDYDEAAPLCPLGVYGQSKAAGEIAVATCPRHYIVRTTWLVGAGPNFVATMYRLAHAGLSPAVVDDQIGRLSFTSELAAGIKHLLTAAAPYGVYHLTGTGEPASFAAVAKRVFRHCGRAPADVRAVSTAEYGADKQLAPRPASSVLSVKKLISTGFSPRPWEESLTDYLQQLDDAVATEQEKS